MSALRGASRVSEWSWLMAIALVMAACAAPSTEAQECAAGGSADEEAFAQHFSDMGFGSGAPPTGEEGQRFTTSEPVVVIASASVETTARLCAQERSRLGTVVYDRTHTLQPGESRIDLGVINTKGDYVIRVSVGETLVRNLTFGVR